MRTSIALIASTLVACAWISTSARGDEPAPSETPAAGTLSSIPFPVHGLMPKREIGALKLLEQHPEYDGRGAVVAVFDTGVDPGAAGLETTSDGKPKILDVIDATGSGDVDTSQVVEVGDSNTLEGLSGRTLTLDRHWLKKERKVRLGIKYGYDIFPGFLVSRLRRERREAFDRVQQKTEDALRRQIAEWDVKHPAPNAKERRLRDELDTRLEQLLAAGKSIEDPGPIYDCVVFQDGETWRAVVDTDEDGDLAEETPLTNFRAERQYGTFGGGSEMNFAVNIYDNGDRLSIVVDSGAHATHVASIIAGYFPDAPERSGIAPGAQIVSIKIGDSYLGSMETGTGLVRGLSAVVELKCDLINMSYGEPTTLPNRGRILDLITETVDEHGVMFVAAAGNNGPGLSTVIAPGGACEAVMGVGAYVSPAMMQAEYALRGELPEMPFSWSSRGPAGDGATGVDVFAPGAAVASVPVWTLNRSMQMNGTSMASPNACGASALLISALKAEKKPYTPYTIRRALQNTARRIDDAGPLTEGTGLIQVDLALDYLLAHAEAEAGAPLRYSVNVDGRANRRGVLLREASEMRGPSRHTVRIRPLFREGAENAEKLGYERLLELHCDQPWVRCGRHMLLTPLGDSLEIEVAPEELTPGLHVTEISAVDSDRPDLGPLLRIPVTVMKPIPAADEAKAVWTEQLTFKPGQVTRRFFAVPAGATWAEVKLQAGGAERQFVVHTNQPRSGAAYGETAEQHYIALGHERLASRRIPVVGGRTLELCLAQFWSSLGETEIELKLAYHGVRPDCEAVTLLPGEPTAAVQLASLVEDAPIDIEARLTTHRHVLHPALAKIRPLLSPRDRLPDGSQPFELLLEYRFEQSTPGRVTPRFPLDDGLLYESPFAGHVWMLYDANKRLIAVDDIHPGGVQLAKGEHLLHLVLRHGDRAKLEAVKDAVLWLDRPLKGPLSLAAYSTQADAAAGTNPLGSRTLEAGERITAYLAAPDAKRLPGDGEPGDVLLGTINYGAESQNEVGTGPRPGGYPLRLMLAAKAPAKSSPGKGGATTEKGLAKEVYDLRVEQLERLGEGEQELFDKLADELSREHPDDLRIPVARLKRLDDPEHRKERLAKVVEAADAIIDHIDTKALAAHYGTNVNREDAKATAERRKMDELRAILVDTLYRKGRALGYMELPDVVEKHPIKDQASLDKAFEANFAELAKWVDTTDAEYFLLHDRRERRQQRYGKALALLNRHIPNSEPDYWHFKKRRDIYGELGWKHLQAWEAAWLVRRFPKAYEPF